MLIGQSRALPHAQVMPDHELAMGILFLSLVSPTVRRRVRKFLHAHPKMAHAYTRWRDKGRQKRLAIIRRRKALAERMHLHRRD